MIQLASPCLGLAYAALNLLQHYRNIATLD